MSEESVLNLFRIRKLEDKDELQVTEHLLEFFFKDEPLNALTKADSYETVQMRVKGYIEGGISLVAVTDSGNIGAIALNKTASRNGTEGAVRKTEVRMFLDTLDDKADIFGNFPEVDTIFRFGILSVDRKYRRLGLAKLLAEKSIELARTKGYKLINADCTSFYSANLMESLGFECLAEIKYEDYKRNGEIIFKTEYPHTEAKSYILKL